MIFPSEPPSLRGAGVQLLTVPRLSPRSRRIMPPAVLLCDREWHTPFGKASAWFDFGKNRLSKKYYFIGKLPIPFPCSFPLAYSRLPGVAQRQAQA
jgi:hypothetical protein